MSSVALSLPTRPFDDRYLYDFSGEHLFHEIDMFFGTGEVLSRGLVIYSGWPEGTNRLNNALVEVLAIHVRNLIDFLYLDSLSRVKPTDILAKDYCEPDAWTAARPAISDSLSAARGRANKEVAHLTSERIAGTPPEKAWNPQALASEIKPLLDLFVANAVPSRLSPRVKVRLS